MSINSIGFQGSFICFSGSLLSEATRRKLIALGIDPSTVKSESEAKAIIEQILEMRKSSKQPIPLEFKNEINKNETEKQTKENSENMLSLLDYDSSLKKIILGL